MEQLNCSIDLNHLLEIKEILSSVNDDLSCERDLLNIDNFIPLLRPKKQKHIKTNGIIKNLKIQAENLKEFENVRPIVERFCYTGQYIFEVPQVTYKQIEVSNKDALTIAGDFFKEQGSFFFEKFDEFFEDVESHLQFVNPNTRTDGCIIFLFSTGEAFVLSPNHKNFTKVTILIHELEHVIDSFHNPSFYTNTLIREASTIFMEMIGADYVSRLLGTEIESTKRKFYLHSIIKRDAYDLYFKNQLLDAVSRYKHMKNSLLKRKLQHLKLCPDTFIKQASQYSLVEDYYYQLAQLIAIELFYIYSTDCQYALYILQDIILHGTDDNIFTLLDKYGIFLLESVSKYEEELCLKLNM